MYAAIRRKIAKVEGNQGRIFINSVTAFLTAIVAVYIGTHLFNTKKHVDGLAKYCDQPEEHNATFSVIISSKLMEEFKRDKEIERKVYQTYQETHGTEE